MTTRKRKQPEKKKKAAPRGPGIALRSLAFAGRVASRHPAAFGGAAAFAVVFSFVAANALWYQPGSHPSPFLRTRVALTQPQIADLPRPGTVETDKGLTPRKVTTFVIEREAQPAPETLQTAGIERAPAESRRTRQTADVPPRAVAETRLVTAVQTELARHGLYDGPADGKTGPKTIAAIRRFEKLSGQPQTGAASDALLAALRTGPKTLAAVTPASRPYEDVTAVKGELDPVAAAIRDAEIDPQFVPKADIPAASELVMNIQKGLSNLAYADVAIDGVAGDQTRAAIRHFEKHYRLPQTGEPNDKVLKKLKEIGAL